MKKLIFLTVFACLLIFFSSCDPEPIPPGPPPVTYTISTVISGKGLVTPDKLSMINLGSNVTLKFTPETGYSLYSVKINGVKVEDIQPSSAEVSYTIHNINKNQNVEVVFVENGILLLSKLEPAWMWTKFDIYRADDNTFLYSVELTEAEKSRKMYHHYPSMEIKYINPDGSVYWQATWDLKQDVYKQGGQTLEVLELTSSKFVYKTSSAWSNVGNCYAYAVYTRERK